MQKATIDGSVRDKAHAHEIVVAVLAALPDGMRVRVTPHLVKVDKMPGRVYTQNKLLAEGGTTPEGPA